MVVAQPLPSAGNVYRVSTPDAVAAESASLGIVFVFSTAAVHRIAGKSPLLRACPLESSAVRNTGVGPNAIPKDASQAPVAPKTFGVTLRTTWVDDTPAAQTSRRRTTGSEQLAGRCAAWTSGSTRSGLATILELAAVKDDTDAADARGRRQARSGVTAFNAPCWRSVGEDALANLARPGCGSYLST